MADGYKPREMCPVGDECWNEYRAAGQAKTPRGKHYCGFETTGTVAGCKRLARLGGSVEMIVRPVEQLALFQIPQDPNR
jgi:hypothetical protein